MDAAKDLPRDTPAARRRPSRRASAGQAARLAVVPAAATVLVFVPVVLRSPSTTQAVPPGWFITLLLAAPLTAYLASRRGPPLGLAAALLVGLPQVPLVVLLSIAAIRLDVQRGHLLAGSGEEAMSYGIGIGVGAIAGVILLILVSAATLLGARRRATGRAFRGPLAGGRR